MKRIVNNRPLCFAAAMLAMGIVLGVLVAESLVLNIIFISLCVAIFVVLACLKKTRKFTYLPLAILVGAVCFFSTRVFYIAKSVNEPATTISATVESEIVVADNKTVFEISNIYLNGKKLNGKARVLLPTETQPNYNAGDIVEIAGSLVSNEFLPLDSYFASAYAKQNTKFCYATSVLKVAEQKPNFILATQLKIKKAFFLNTKEDTASICIALIYGDKSSINAQLYQDVKTSGLAHILAVSGMHLGFLAAAVAFCCKRMKLNKKATAFVVIAMLLVYALFCGFSSSVTRAFIMVSIYFLANAFGKKKDSLSLLSLAGIIILVMRPIALFEVGFLLSFTSVLGILLFYRSFNHAFQKTGKLSPLIATNLSANIMTFPVVAKYFGVVPIFSLITNLIILPIIAVLFVLVLISALLVALFPIAQILMIFDYIFLPLKVVVFTAGSIAVSTIKVESLGLMSVAYYVDMVVLSRFVFLKKNTKVIIVCSVTALCALLAFLVCILI